MQAIKTIKNIWHSNNLQDFPRYLLSGIKFQLFKRFSKDQLIKTLFNNKKIIVDPKNPVTTQVFYSKIPDKQEIEILRKSANQNTYFLDIGANVGLYCLLLSDIVNKFYAFEPHPATFTQLKLNFLLNNFSENLLINKAVGENNNILYFTNQANASPINHVINQKSINTIEVGSISLDNFIDNLNYPENSEFLIKIDVEGFEWQVLMGAKKFLQNLKLKGILFERYSDDFAKIVALLEQHGFIIEYLNQQNVFARR